MDQGWREAFRYNTWANLRLLEVCASLDEDRLQLTSAGTYGTIAATFQHLLAAEQRYVMRLGGSEPRLTEKDDFPGLDALRGHAQRSGEELVTVVERLTPDATTETVRDGRKVQLKLWVVAVQAVHHGNDHRTHICTILGQNGIEYGDLDVWAYGVA